MLKPHPFCSAASWQTQNGSFCSLPDQTVSPETCCPNVKNAPSLPQVHGGRTYTQGRGPLFPRLRYHSRHFGKEISQSIIDRQDLLPSPWVWHLPAMNPGGSVDSAISLTGRPHPLQIFGKLIPVCVSLPMAVQQNRCHWIKTLLPDLL